MDWYAHCDQLKRADAACHVRIPGDQVRTQSDMRCIDGAGWVIGRKRCMSKKAPSPGMEAAFDYVGRVIARRRFGYVSEWRQLASWTEKDWERWLAATDQVSN